VNATKSQHAQAIIGVVAYTFLASYISTPSIMSFLHGHQWVADIAGSLIAAYHVYQTYSNSSAGEPAKEKEDVH